MLFKKCGIALQMPGTHLFTGCEISFKYKGTDLGAFVLNISVSN